MSTDPLAALLAASGTQLARGIVVGIAADGAVVVERSAAEDGVLPCDVLEGPLSPQLDLTPGDEVLVWLPEPADRGVVIGRVGPARFDAPRVTVISTAGAEQETPDTLVIEAKEALTLKVGRASITIRGDGKILIKGSDLVSHAERVNRIKGGAVAIN